MRLKLGIIIGIIMTLTLSVSAVKYGDLGEVYYIYSDKIAPGLEYKELHADDQRGFVFEYTPQMGTVPIVVNGGNVFGRVTLGNMINKASDTGDVNVTAGINADFFSMQTGVPLGVMINDGKLYASCEGGNAFGLYPNGLAVIGKPETDITLTIGNREDKIEYFNKYPSVYEIYVLNSDYNDTTKSKEPSLEIVVKPERDSVITQWCDISGVITDIYRDSNDSVIEDGYIVITIANECKFYEKYKDVKIGDEVNLTFRCADEWRDVVTAVGGGDIILEHGIMPDGIVDEEHEGLDNPRTAVGITREGKVIFFAVDGRRKGHSIGLTLEELASAMRGFDCVQALNFDGGGSTTVIVKDNVTGDYKLKNRPTDGEQRRISSSILFVNKMQSDGTADNIKITPSSPYVLSKGGKVPLGINVFDAAYTFIETGAECDYELSNDIGYIEDGVFTATAESGSGILTARLNIEGRVLTAETEITIVPTLTDFEVIPEAEYIGFGGTMQLNFKGYRLTYETFVSPDRFTIECDSGTVDSDGVFHHSGMSKDDVSIKITYGKKTQYITLTILDFAIPYTDIAGHWAEPYISTAFANGWYVGEMADADNNFRPNTNITRSEFAAMLALFSGFEIGDGETWDTPYINAVIEAGLMRGKLMNDGTVDFCGADYISRTEMMYVFTDMLMDYEIEPTELEFTDVADIPEWAADRINLAVSAGIVRGYEDNTIRPLNEVTRAEAAVMFVRLKEIMQ